MLVKYGRRKLGEGQDLDHGGVVHQRIDVAEPVDGPAHDSLGRVGFIQIEAQRQGPAAGGLDVRHYFVEQFDATADQRNIPSGSGESSCGGGADSSAGAGDDCGAHSTSPVVW